MTDTLGDAPIEPHLISLMNDVAHALDVTFNGETHGTDRKVGFVLLVFPFHGAEGRCNYISNGTRKDIVVLLKEQIARLEGQPEMKGTA